MICSRPATKFFEIDPIDANVIRFRPRDAAGRRGPMHGHEHAQDAAAPDQPAPRPFELLELARYQAHPRRDLMVRDDVKDAGREDFKLRMRVNIAAMMFLVALAGLAAGTVLRLEAQMTAEMVRGGLI